MTCPPNPSPNGAVKPAPNSPAGDHSACLPAGRGFFGGIIGTLTERVALLLFGSASTSAGGGPRPQTSLGPLPAQMDGWDERCAALPEERMEAHQRGSERLARATARYDESNLWADTTGAGRT